jgi:hypothetical protein
MIPDDELWLHEPAAAAELQAALEWAVEHAPSDAETPDILRRLADAD